MISIHVKHVSNIINEQYKATIDTYAITLKNNMHLLLLNPNAKEDWQQQYIKKIIDLHKKLIIATPLQLKAYKSTFDSIMESKKVKQKLFLKFREALIKEMGYSQRRGDFYPIYFQKIGLRSCVYCNSQFALSVETDSFYKKRKKTTKIEAKFQVDHFIPKSQYPCFSISLFNLYPVCATCNNIKSSLEVNFELYNQKHKENISKYEFSLEKGCVANYLTSNFKVEELKIIFKDPDKPDPQLPGNNSLSDTFDIKGIYDTQLDIVEELIQKRRIYNISYRETLVKSFPDLFNHSSLSERTLLGNYHLPEDIHKRPMAKFMQDIDNYLKSIIDPNTGLPY